MRRFSRTSAFFLDTQATVQLLVLGSRMATEPVPPVLPGYVDAAILDAHGAAAEKCACFHSNDSNHALLIL